MSPLPDFPPSAYRPPHPREIVPKLVLLIGALLAFAHLFYRLAHPEEPPHPVRVGLLHAEREQDAVAALASGLVLPSPLELAKTPRISRLTHPLGGETGALTYNARPFGEVDHLGDDLNGIGGENSDLGDPVYAIGDGLVIAAAPASEGWGKVVVLQHRLDDGRLFQSFYGHLDTIEVTLSEKVHRGQVIGTVGTAGGKYFAHLHFEIRDSVSLGAGTGYSPLRLDRKNPAEFLREHGVAGSDDLLPALRTVAEPLTPEREVQFTPPPERKYVP